MGGRGGRVEWPRSVTSLETHARPLRQLQKGCPMKRKGWAIWYKAMGAAKEEGSSGERQTWPNCLRCLMFYHHSSQLGERVPRGDSEAKEPSCTRLPRDLTEQRTKNKTDDGQSPVWETLLHQARDIFHLASLVTIKEFYELNKFMMLKIPARTHLNGGDHRQDNAWFLNSPLTLTLITEESDVSFFSHIAACLVFWHLCIIWFCFKTEI